MTGRDLKKLWAEVVRFNNKYFPGWRRTEPVYYSNALAGEAGEICNEIKHIAGGGTHSVYSPKDKVIEETFDVLVYTILLLESMGYNHRDFIDNSYKKLDILRKRMKNKTGR